eukprot:13807858-Ditylum_brightwellii.AAC.1
MLNVSPCQVKVKAGGTRKDSSKVSSHDDLKVSQSKCHANGGKQMTKLGVAKGREYDSDELICNLKGKKNKRRKTLDRK